MNNEMKARTSNVLIAVFWALAVVVWFPTLFAMITGSTSALGGWTMTINTVSPYYGPDVQGDGVAIWAAITGAVVAAQYLIAGTVRFKFQKQ